MKLARWALVAVLVGLVPAKAAAAGPGSATPAASTFEQLVEQGDKARAARQWAAAVVAYSEARKLQDDLTVTGRLGLALLELGEHAAAASQLYRVVEEPTAIKSDLERQRFSDAYKAARGEVCRLDVTLDKTGARVVVDGELVREGPADFWLFIEPGEHELRASLDGFEDETKVIRAERGARLPVPFTMRQKTTPRAPAPEPRVEVRLAPSPSSPPTPAPRSTPPARLLLGAGVALVLGATPGAALGPQFFAAWRPREWGEVGVDLRAAWALAGFHGFPDVQLVAWSATIAPCGRWHDWLFGCVLGQVDGVFSDDLFGGGYERTGGLGVLLGLGLRGGVEFVLRERLRVQLWGDGVAHRRGFRPLIDEGDEWRGSPIVGSFGVRSVVMF